MKCTQSVFVVQVKLPEGVVLFGGDDQFVNYGF